MALDTITFTAELDPTARWVVLTVACTGMTQATIYRVTPAGGQAVRGCLAVDAVDALVAADYEAPQNTTLVYWVSVTDGSLVDTSALVTVVGSVDRGSDVVFGLTNPVATQAVNVIGIPELQSTIRQEAVTVVGRADPIIVSDVRQYPSGTLTLATLTDLDRSAVMGLLTSGAVIAFSPWQPTFGFDEIWYLSVGQVTEKRVSRLGAQPERFIAMEFQRVAPPPADFIGPAFNTWTAALAGGATWGDLYSSAVTWLEYEVA